MGTTDLRELSDDTIVLHFGGAIASVDAYTFANALINFANAATSTNRIIHPGETIEIRLVAVGPGSYRAQIRKIRKGLGGLFSRAPEALLWGVLSTYIYEKAIAPDVKPAITINSNEVVIQNGADKLIVPRITYDQLPNIRNNIEVDTALAKTFSALEADKTITEFGITGSLGDSSPILRVDRSEFKNISDLPIVMQELDLSPQHKKIRTRVLIHKAWLNHAKRKWTFEWNGVPISAHVTDQNFLKKIDDREVLFGAGDALDVDIEFNQAYLDDVEVFKNDPQSYIITKVYQVVPRKGKQSSLKIKK
jgi:hypothetical protein